MAKKYEIELSMSIEEAFEFAKAIKLLFDGSIESVSIGPNNNPCIVWSSDVSMMERSFAAWLLDMEGLEPKVAAIFDSRIVPNAEHLLVK